MREPIYGKNPDRAKIIREIKRGRLTIPQASKKYGVPISGIVGWLKLAGVEVPEEFQRPRRDRGEPTLSRGRLDR